jgi:hypothetical protein
MEMQFLSRERLFMKTALLISITVSSSENVECVQDYRLSLAKFYFERKGYEIALIRHYGRKLYGQSFKMIQGMMTGKDKVVIVAPQKTAEGIREDILRQLGVNKEICIWADKLLENTTQ